MQAARRGWGWGQYSGDGEEMEMKCGDGVGEWYKIFYHVVIYIWPKTYYSDNVVVKTLSALKDNALALSMISHIM